MATCEPDLGALFRANRLAFSPRNAGKSEADRLLVQALRAAGQEVLEVGPKTHRNCNDIDHVMDAARYVAAHDSPAVQNAHRSHKVYSEEELAEIRRELRDNPPITLPVNNDPMEVLRGHWGNADSANIEQPESYIPDHTLAELVRENPKIQIIMEGDGLPDEIEINGVRFLREKPIEVRVPQGRRIKL